MAQIQEYLPETQAPEAISGATPNIDFAGAVGRGIQTLGNDVEQAGGIIHRRNVQEETADVYSAFADKRAEYTQKVQQGIQDGTLDQEELQQQYEDDVSKIGDNIDTPEAKNFFNRQAARLKGHVTQMAAAGQAAVAKNEAMASYQNGVNKTSSSIMASPWSFQDAYESGVETVDELIKNGGLPEKMRGKALQDMGVEYSKGAIRGWAELNPDKAKEMIDSGAFDQFLDSDKKHQMLMEVSHYQTAKEVEGRRAEKAQEDAQKQASEAWGVGALPKLATGSLSTKDVLGAVKDGTLKWEQGERWLKMIDEGAKQDLKTNPRTKNDLIQRIVDPNSHNPIDSVEDLMPYVGKGISVTDFNQLNGLINRTPEQQALHQGEKALFDSARRTVRYKNMMTNTWDVMGEQKLAQFMSDYNEAKKSAKANAISPGDLVNPNSPNYFGNRLQDYQTSMQDQLAGVAQDRTNKALGLRPSHEVPDGKPTSKDVKRPNESAADYLKRRGLGG